MLLQHSVHAVPQAGIAYECSRCKKVYLCAITFTYIVKLFSSLEGMRPCTVHILYIQSSGKAQYEQDYSWVASQSTYRHRVPQCMFPRRNWDSPTPSPVSECTPPSRTKRWGAHSPAGEGVGASQFQ
jgi:hypothetical protein